MWYSVYALLKIDRRKEFNFYTIYNYYITFNFYNKEEETKECELLMFSWNQVVTIMLWTVHLTSIWNRSRHWSPSMWNATCNDCVKYNLYSPLVSATPLWPSRRSPGAVWKVCLPHECVKCVWGASSRQKARGCCLTLICKGRQYGSLTCPAPLSAAHTSPSPPRWLRCSLNTSSRLPQAQSRGGRRDTGCFDNEYPKRKDGEEAEPKLWLTRLQKEEYD